MSQTLRSYLQANILANREFPGNATVTELKDALRERGLRTTGRKSDLRERLIDHITRSKLKEEPEHFSYDNSPSVSHPLQIVPFDGKGRDPAGLVGMKFDTFEHDPAGLVLHCTNNETITIDFWEIFLRYAQIKADDVLLEALSRYTEGEEAKDGGEKGLLIEEAAVGMRQGPQGEYRVVGIRVEGMETMGWVFCEDEELDDMGLGIPMSEIPRFADVAVAEGRESLR